jgi:outer membrane lipoprotein-sorting protein
MGFNIKNLFTRKLWDKELTILLNRIKTYYQESVTDLCCYTERRAYGDAVGGILKYKKGDRYRQETKDGLCVDVCDGKNIFRYDKRENVIYKAPLKTISGIKFSSTFLNIITGQILSYRYGPFKLHSVSEEDDKYIIKFGCIVKDRKTHEKLMEEKFEVVTKKNLSILSLCWNNKKYLTKGYKLPSKLEEAIKKDYKKHSNIDLDKVLDKSKPFMEALFSYLLKGKFPGFMEVEDIYTDIRENIGLKDEEFEFIPPHGVMIKKLKAFTCVDVALSNQ